MLYSRESVRTKTYEQAKQFDDDMRDMLIKSKVISNDMFCLTSDIWTEPSNNFSYLQTHIQWMDDFSLKNCVLEMEHFPERHTGLNIEEKLFSVVSSIGARPESTVIVTDCGSNMLNAVSKMNGLPCACHRMSTAIEQGWKKALAESDNLTRLNDSVNMLINTVNHKSNLQQKFFYQDSVIITDKSLAWTIQEVQSDFHQL